MRLLIICLAALLIAGPAIAEEELGISIPYERYTLENGLTLIVHEDRKAPIVAVNLWYHVGSKNEKKGKTGFAHLFEHLMFNGSEHFNDDYFQALQPLGATDLNGTTSFDRTNYFQTVPTAALDRVLWLESDRMGHLLGVVDQAKLDEQRGVVQNEKREGENAPYGDLWSKILPRVFPPNHPYSWSVIGSMEDLDAASLDDVKEWFRTYYGPSNATIVLAGDITPEEALRKVTHYFGSIPSGPPVVKQKEWIAKRSGTQHLVINRHVPQALLMRVWNVPGFGLAENDYLSIAGDVLGYGKSSRLYKRLVLDEQLATQVNVSPWTSEIAALFIIRVMAKPDADLDRVDRILDEELARLRDSGPTQKELDRIRTQVIGDYIRGAERIGGFGGKSDILASGQVYMRQPDYYRTELDRLREMTLDQVTDSANRWLSDGDLRVQVLPVAKYGASAEDADREGFPELGGINTPEFPDTTRMTLRNGLEVILVERHDVPLVLMQLQTRAGYAQAIGEQAGLARMTFTMMDEGTKQRDALEISDALSSLGAELSVTYDRDQSSVVLSALKAHLDESLAIFADVILNPSFPDDALTLSLIHI